VVVGGQGLQARRLDYEELRVTSAPFASDDKYLSRYDLSAELLDSSLADVPAGEPLIFVRRYDDHMFEEFSILSYTTWPRRLYALGCSDSGQPEYTDFAPLTGAVRVAIVDSEQAVVGSEDEVVQHIAPTTWLVRASQGGTWSSFCR
jgi:hypothetical protein